MQAQWSPRKTKALTIAATPDAIQAHDNGSFTVWSQTDETISYTVRLPDPLDPTTATCTCADFGFNGGSACKHIIAAGITLTAKGKVRALAAQHDLDLPQLASRIENDLMHGIPSEAMAQKYLILLHACNRLADQEQPKTPTEIALIIKYATSGGRHLPHVSGSGEIRAIIEDGHKRKPKVSDPEKAYSWLQHQGYESISKKWIDPAGYYRRRRETFRLAPAGI